MVSKYFVWSTQDLGDRTNSHRSRQVLYVRHPRAWGVGQMMKDDARSSIRFRARGRMAVHTIWDQITRPIARTIDDVPWSAEAISPEWLTAVLCSASPGARVTSVEIVGGDQGSSVRRQLTVTYNDEGKNAGLPENLFCKTTPTVLTRLATGLSAAGEARFYRHIRPELTIEAPVCFHSAWERNSGRSVHLFNDVVADKGLDSAGGIRRSLARKRSRSSTR